jgi:hypothetical protein
MALLATISLSLPLSASAAAARIAFTSPPQAIEPGAPSGMITIEAEDAAGEAAKGSTICVVVSSDSATGQLSTNASSWSASSSNSLALTISSNQYRRNFYYQNSSEGTFTLFAKAAIKPSGTTCSTWKGTASWSASQPITVKIGASIPPPPPPPAPPPATTVTSQKQSKQVVTTTKKTSKKITSASYHNNQPSDTASDVQAAPLQTPPSPESQLASPNFVGDFWWWILAAAFIVAGCSFLALSYRHKKTEWNIVDEQGKEV